MALNVGFIANQRQPQIDIPDPVADQAKGYQLRELAMKDRMGQQAMADDQAQRQAFSQAGGDQAKYLQALATGGNYKAYQGAQKAALDTDKAKADIGHVNAQTNKQQIDAQLDMLERGSSILATAKDQKSYDAARQALAQTLGPQAAEKLNPVFDPMLVQGYVNAGLKRADQIKNETQLLAQKETARHNTATEGLTERGQNMIDARSRDSTAATMSKPFEVTGPDGQPTLVQQDKQGNIKPVQGYSAKTVADKPLNDNQSKALLFGSRMREADKVLRQLATEGTETSIPGSNAPIIGGVVSAVSSGNRQMLDQAKRDFMTAVLRRESGAAISSGEFATADKQYFPQIGDSDKVKAQKQRNRDLATQGILVEVPAKQRDSLQPRESGATGSFDTPTAPAKTKAGASVSNW